MDEAWLETVRLARDCGDISSLFPRGITRVWDLPWTIHSAIRSALMFLRFEELPEEEKPPKHIWLDGDRMKAWWAEVKTNRDNKYKGGGDLQAMPKNDMLAEIFGRDTP